MRRKWKRRNKGHVRSDFRRYHCSPFEFERGNKTKEFELFGRRSSFTDDSVMTVAVAEALLKAGTDAEVSVIRQTNWGCWRIVSTHNSYFRQPQFHSLCKSILKHL